MKVERVGTLNYPAEARGKLYGNLRLTVTIRPDGSVESVELDRSSGLKVLDAAAFKIVRRWRGRSPRSRPTSAATPTSSSSRAPGSSARATRSGRMARQ